MYVLNIFLCGIRILKQLDAVLMKQLKRKNTLLNKIKWWDPPTLTTGLVIV